WETNGRILSFSEGTWDATQKAGYVALIDTEWGGSYTPEAYRDTYWLSYLGGSETGYEAGQLGVGLATTTDITQPQAWQLQPSPVLSASDADARWYDNETIFKSLIIADEDRISGFPFVMYYNAKGREKDTDGNGFESIAMAVSSDMKTWKRYGNGPLITKRTGICGDAQIAKIGDVFVMF